MQTMLLQRQDPNIRAYFIWGPFLRSDTEESARSAASKLILPNAVYFWTPSPNLSAAFAAVLRLPMGRLAWDVYLLYRRGAIWDRGIPQPAYWQHQLEILQGEAFNIAVMETRIHQALQQ